MGQHREERILNPLLLGNETLVQRVNLPGENPIHEFPYSTLHIIPLSKAEIKRNRRVHFPQARIGNCREPNWVYWGEPHRQNR